MFSNCLIWALWRFVRRGGYIAICWNRRHPITHWFHSDELHGPWYSLTPLHKRRIPWPLFRGHVKEGD